MKRRGRIVFILLLAAVVMIQFIRPERNQGSRSTEADIATYLQVPEEVSKTLQNSCYDCHSDLTEYPWYSKVAPVSWLLGRHIREGKKEVNFSEFGHLEKKDMIRVLSDMCRMVKAGSMPIPSYRLMHKKAALSEEDAKLLCEWSKTEAMKLLKE
jgi:hypothetical protein